MAKIKVEFRQAFYDGKGNYFDKGSVHELDAGAAIPTRDVKILEGKSTYKKPTVVKAAAPKAAPSKPLLETK